MSSDARNGTCPDGQTGSPPACQAATRVDESVGDFQPEACPSLRWWGRAAVGELRGTPLRLKWGGHRSTLGPGMSPPTDASQAAGCPEAVAVWVAGRALGAHPHVCPLEPFGPQLFSLPSSRAGTPPWPQPPTQAASAQRVWW